MSFGRPSLTKRALPLLSKLEKNTTFGDMVLNKDFREFIASLNENNVCYMIVGGYAVGFHGYPRYTKDLDVWIEVSHENAENVVKALNQFGFGAIGFKSEDFLKSDKFT